MALLSTRSAVRGIAGRASITIAGTADFHQCWRRTGVGAKIALGEIIDGKSQASIRAAESGPRRSEESAAHALRRYRRHRH
jgi:hypothetical protein